MNTYLRILPVFYLYGALVHLADLLSLGHHLGQTHGLAFPEMSLPWQIGTVGFAAVDLVAASPCRTEPSTHDTTFFWADECWCAGEVLTTDGAYTKHQPIFGPLPGAS